MAIKTFTDLDAWKEGHKLVLMIYNLTRIFPKEETFGLTIQMKRSAVSITSNIAEGFSRRSFKEKLYFYAISQGSVTELQNQLIIAKDVSYIKKDEEYQKLFAQSILVHKIINGLIKSTKSYFSS